MSPFVVPKIGKLCMKSNLEIWRRQPLSITRKKDRTNVFLNLQNQTFPKIQRDGRAESAHSHKTNTNFKSNKLTEGPLPKILQYAMLRNHQSGLNKKTNKSMGNSPKANQDMLRAAMKRKRVIINHNKGLSDNNRTLERHTKGTVFTKKVKETMTEVLWVTLKISSRKSPRNNLEITCPSSEVWNSSKLKGRFRKVKLKMKSNNTGNNLKSLAAGRSFKENRLAST